MSQQKHEKAQLDAKIAEVREVVRHASNTEIILALHNFDMDVNRTIHAFTEGKDAALGDWETNGAGGKKKKNKKKPSGASAPNPVPSKPTPAPAKPTTSEPPKPKVDVAKVNETVQTFKNLDDSARTDEAARLSKVLDHTVQRLKQTLSEAEAQKKAALQVILAAVEQRDRHLSGELEAVRLEVERQTQKQRALLEKIQKSAQDGDIAKFTTGNAVLEQILATPFVFDENPPLRSIGKFGSVYQTGNIVVPPVVAPVASKQHQANGQPKPAERKSDKKQNGAPAPATKAVNGVQNKISTSQSSLVSSEDSGLGQISPIVQQEKVRTQAGGIVMEAEGISLDALADIQRTLAEQLKAQGIDESILSGLSGIGGTNVVAPRRRAPKKDGPKDKKNGGKPIGAH